MENLHQGSKFIAQEIIKNIATVFKGFQRGHKDASYLLVMVNGLKS